MTSEQVAELFHTVYEELAPQFSYRTSMSSAVAWVDVPEANKLLMIATAARVMEEMAIRPQAAVIE